MAVAGLEKAPDGTLIAAGNKRGGGQAFLYWFNPEGEQIAYFDLKQPFLKDAWNWEVDGIELAPDGSLYTAISSQRKPGVTEASSEKWDYCCRGPGPPPSVPRVCASCWSWRKATSSKSFEIDPTSSRLYCIGRRSVIRSWRSRSRFWRRSSSGHGGIHPALLAIASVLFEPA